MLPGGLKTVNFCVLIFRGGSINAEIGKCLSPYVSASSAQGYYICCYCPSGTSENILRMVHLVVCCSDIGKCLFTLI